MTSRQEERIYEEKRNTGPTAIDQNRSVNSGQETGPGFMLAAQMISMEIAMISQTFQFRDRDHETRISNDSQTNRMTLCVSLDLLKNDSVFYSPLITLS